MNQQLPAGWNLHPENPEFAYHGQEVRRVAELVGALQAPAAPPVAQVPSQYPQQAATQPQAQAEVPWGEADTGAMDEDLAAAKQARTSRNNKEDEIYLDFDDFPKPRSKGQKVELFVRLLPPWARGVQKPYIRVHMLWIPAWYWPEQYDGKALPVVSYETKPGPDGPGPDPIQQVLNEIKASGPTDEVSTQIRRMRSTRIYWQGYDVQNLDRHWLQVKDENGTPVVDAQGQYQYAPKPGIVTMGNKLHNKVLENQNEYKTSITSVERGRPIKLVKSVTGPEPMNVDYDCFLYDPAPIPEQARPLLYNLIDLEARYVRFKSRSLMEKCAQIIGQKLGGRGPSVQVPVQVQPAQAPAQHQAPAAQYAQPAAPVYQQPQGPPPAPTQPQAALPAQYQAQPPGPPPAPPAPAQVQYDAPPPAPQGAAPPIAPPGAQPPPVPQGAAPPALAQPSPGMAHVQPTTIEEMERLAGGR